VPRLHCPGGRRLGNIRWITLGGAIIGVLARLLLPGRQNVPWSAVLGVGIVARFVGDVLAGRLGVTETSGVDWIRHDLLGVPGIAGLVAIRGRDTSGA